MPPPRLVAVAAGLMGLGAAAAFALPETNAADAEADEGLLSAEGGEGVAVA